MDPAMLTVDLATEIATETSEILGYRVLITDNDGLVIGSGEPERIGTLHSPSIEVVATQRASSRTRAELADAGVRPGITMPITIDGATIGTVGIAGPPRTVRKLGRLVQRQTEILLRESLAHRTRVLHENAVAQLVRDIVMYDERVLEERVLTARAEELGYDLSGDRVAITVEPRDDRRPLRIQAVREVFPGREDIVTELAPERCLVLHRTGRAPRERLVERCRSVLDTLRLRGGSDVRLGVGGIGRGVTALSRSCEEAGSALRIGTRCSPGEAVIDIEDVRVHQIVESVPAPVRSGFAERQLSALRARGDYEHLRATVIAWCTGGFHLGRTAALLNVHRNTVVYRLERIGQLTGTDIREPRHALAMHLACLADQLAGSE